MPLQGSIRAMARLPSESHHKRSVNSIQLMLYYKISQICTSPLGSVLTSSIVRSVDRDWHHCVRDDQRDSDGLHRSHRRTQRVRLSYRQATPRWRCCWFQLSTLCLQPVTSHICSVINYSNKSIYSINLVFSVIFSHIILLHDPVCYHTHIFTWDLLY